MTAVERAAQFFGGQGRDIDRERFRYHFGGGTRQQFLDVLSRYQNADGGFGHGLEPDISAPVSNPFATELALLYCIQADVPNDPPLLRRAVDYLEATQYEDGSWRFSREVYESDLAPWFAGWTWPNLNPTCTIAGLLRRLGLGSARLHERVGQLFRELARPADLLSDEFYTVRPYAYYFDADGGGEETELYRAGMLWWLIRQHETGKVADGSHFFEYARTPDRPVARHIPKTTLESELDRLALEQDNDGGWPSPYGEQWHGAITVQSLLVLQAYGRLG
ncbi:MAG TPA: hypothetical protein VIL85_15550 [Thermomicrobiales bacterium]|jgi:hypothetical protein